MPIYALGKHPGFPPASEAEPDGLLAIGGDLSTQRLLNAYRSGIFPWYEGDHILWWSPNPRFVLFPSELKVSKSMKPILNGKRFSFTVNKAFEAVIRNCQQIERKGQDGTWISAEVVSAYCRLHELGYAESAETWLDGELVGGCYGIRMGKVFFGESMFRKVSNASKYAFIKYVGLLETAGVELVDCQVYTEHLESLGAKMIDRTQFLQLLDLLIPGQPVQILP
ncbi:leucyl/phenylalanyl-tRNA--protein transferase [Flavihumibacter rivuli]|uniref:leucyl/phenylalanyl-tRNA--protein transferase n=1 Tax=Flavihumibacter rivuli TaxID=2838156 RepID=UPI001BDEC8A3|nr:leucyl/phenylalanyl-tRNA--protein transferase [Flavihumibacter rivuli]ULQ57438.1 leucyl/phenylalanyl-tRNA--protein transferase [Flavihumibacter rivuli]